MGTRQTFYIIALVFWLISTFYFLYKYSLDAGYWKNPLLISVFFYIVVIVINRGFNKLITCISVFYFGFGVWFIFDLLLAIGDVLSVP
ncbi:hypothetical protein [Cytobacillus oceanisediminis]|uniref:hypothetical protein n=1 Tax=Cytobacillus oceanisediminis TaxID=665099 RepID=UPI00207A59AB|nr:hypothetical protein [Cytobacillus oceanisediminis]USK46325.1 hypothetical protein LIT27_10900 [Cytobacillus oceanisediminis]